MDIWEVYRDGTKVATLTNIPEGIRESGKQWFLEYSGHLARSSSSKNLKSLDEAIKLFEDPQHPERLSLFGRNN